MSAAHGLGGTGLVEAWLRTHTGDEPSLNLSVLFENGIRASDSPKIVARMIRGELHA